MPRLPVFDPATIRLWELVRGFHGRLGRIQRLGTRDSPDRLATISHMHPVPTLQICLLGSARVHSQQPHPIDMRPGDLLIIAPGAWHRHETVRADSVLYSQGLMPTHSDLALWRGADPIMLTIPLEPTRLLMHRLLDASPGTDHYTTCDEIVAQFLHEQAHPAAVLEGPLAAMTYFLWHHFHEPITAADVLQRSGIGATQATSIFRGFHGCSPGETLLRSRLAIARQLVEEGLPIGSIPRRCGFNSGNHLARAFRRQFGAAPRTWQALAPQERARVPPAL